MNFDKIINRKGTNCIKYDKMEQFIGSSDLLAMWVADMDFETPDFVMNAIKTRAEHPILGYSYRTDSFNKAVAEWMYKRHNWEVKPDEISFSPGVVPGLFLALKGFSKEGDKIIVQPPVYFPFFTTVKANNRKITYNKLIEKEGYYSMDFENLKENMDSNTKMIFVSNPHNPVGRAWKLPELERLVDLCHAHNVLIISDEIHSDLIIKPHKHIPIASINDKAKEITITLMAPSKTFNMAGLSSSIVIAQNPELLKRYNQMLDATHLGQGNIFGNIATEAAYSNGEAWLESLLEYIEGNISVVENLVKKYPQLVKMVRPEATYLLWLDFRAIKLSDNELTSLFNEKLKIGVNAGAMFGDGGSGFMRMNIAMPRTLVLEAADRMDKLFELMVFNLL